MIGHGHPMPARAALPVDLEETLNVIGKRLEKGEPVGDAISPAIDRLASLPPSSISQVANKIAFAARLFHRHPPAHSFANLFREKLSDKEQLLKFPDLKYLFLFHYDGRMREAAVQRLNDGIPSPFFFAALAYRLNDWVEPVRQAALASARRCFPQTDANVVAATAEALILRLDSWGRWTGERDAIEAAFGRDDVVEQLSDHIASSVVGPSARLLKHSLKSPAMDGHLPRLASEAKQPSVRAVAVHALSASTVAWQTGWEWKWIDKSMGHRIQAPHIQSRALSVQIDRVSVVRAAARDRSGLVRRQSLDAIIRNDVPEAVGREIAESLAKDKSHFVRERAAFIIKGRDQFGS